MLSEDEPTFDNWDQDATAIAERYGEQDPEVVAEELESSAETFVARIQALEPGQFERRARRSDGAEFTVATLLQYFLHDIVHHLWDVTGQQDAAIVADDRVSGSPRSQRVRTSQVSESAARGRRGTEPRVHPVRTVIHPGPAVSPGVACRRLSMSAIRNSS